MITVHTLASGSEGNCLVIDAEGTRILVDAGISTRRIKTALEQLGIALTQVDAILITHGHSDHISGLQTLVKRHRIPIYASPATACQLAWRIAGIGPMLREVQRLTPFTVGAARITPFETSHDAAGSIDYRIDAAGGSVGILTDTGLITDEAADVLAGAAFLMLESNHDEECLRSGPYPYSLKQRILGPLGHLSNDAAAAFAAQMARLGTREIVLAHLSRENNTPAMALERVGRALSGTGVRLSAAPRRDLGGPYIVEVSNAKGQHPLCGETEGEVLPRCSGGIQ